MLIFNICMGLIKQRVEEEGPGERVKVLSPLPPPPLQSKNVYIYVQGRPYITANLYCICLSEHEHALKQQYRFALIYETLIYGQTCELGKQLLDFQTRYRTSHIFAQYRESAP